MTTIKPRTKKGVDEISLLMTKIAISKPQINIIKSSVAAFMSDSNDEAATSEGEE